MCIRDRALLGEAFERAVERARLQLDLAGGEVGDRLHDPVAVPRLGRERGKDEKRRFLHAGDSTATDI